jgi:site-specific DNA-methyltransferase (adenine-specific)
MRKEIIGDCELYQGDCLDYMATLPDKAFDIAIVDPPYFTDNTLLNGRESP